MLLFPFPTFAHDNTDWRTDKDAYANVVMHPLPKPTAPLAYEKVPVDQEFFRDILAKLSGSIPVRIDGQEVKILERGSKRARDYTNKFLAEEYSKLGYKVSTQEFSNGANFIAEKEGLEPDKVLIISSHLDSVGNAGANDDGTGTAGALAIAQALSGRPSRLTLRFLAFDREEAGLVGSRAYVQQLDPSEKIMGVVQMEMMGVNKRKDGAFHVIDCDRQDSVFLSQHLMNAVVALDLPLKRSATCTSRSDHASFWRKKIPAIVVSENFFGGDGDPCYHASCDRFDERLDFAYMNRIQQALASAIAHILEEE